MMIKYVYVNMTGQLRPGRKTMLTDQVIAGVVPWLLSGWIDGGEKKMQVQLLNELN